MNEFYDTPRPSASNPKLILGIGLIILGVVVALDNMGLADMHVVLKLWPLILVVFGFAKVRSEHSTGGYALIIIGLFLLLVMFGHRHIEDLIGPMLLVGGGIFVITRTLRKHRGLPQELRDTENTVAGTAIFSGFKRRVITQAFRGGELTAIFGGFHVDLRQAVIAEGRARIDIFVLFGGGEIKVPQEWEVDIQASAVFGGIEDKTFTRGEAPQEGRQRLVISGLALFGGMEVSN